MKRLMAPCAAAAEDLGAIGALLEQAGLPTSDLAAAQPEFVVIRKEGRVIAAGGLERFASAALLRSVVVSGEHRGAGIGAAVVAELERLAAVTRIRQLVLLTESAAAFFARRGYRVIERSAAPEAVRASAEFRTLCPGSAICMAKTLPGRA